MRIRTGNSPEVLTLLWKETISLGMGTSVGMLFRVNYCCLTHT